MKINIQSLSFHASDKLTDFTLDKVNKLEQFSEKILHANVVLKMNKSKATNNKFCEIRLSLPGNDLFAGKQQATFEEAVLKTVETLKQQLLGWKEKTQDKSRTSSSDLNASDH